MELGRDSTRKRPGGTAQPGGTLGSCQRSVAGTLGAQGKEWGSGRVSSGVC